MNVYKTLRDKHTQEVNAFPMFFAFTNEQFEEGMKKIGLTTDDTEQIYKFGNTGGFYRRTDAPRLKEMFNRHRQERQEAIEADKKGNGYIFDMFRYELANQEYVVTWDLTDTLSVLDLSPEDIEKNTPLKNGLNKAIAEIKKKG